jgi:predicted Zn-dependent peptidase
LINREKSSSAGKRPWVSRRAIKGYHKSVLPNGIRIIGEEISDFNSVTVGVFVFTGGRDEPADERGIAHFAEHMLFKGTGKRTSLDISKHIDRVGGILNAYTNKEYTCYYVKIVKDELPLGMELLADIFLNSILPEDELEREKQVVLQEIGMVRDTPDDLVHDLMMETLFGNNALGHSILGTEDHVNNFTRDKVFQFMDDFYLNDRIVIACAGNFQWHDFLDNAGKHFGAKKVKDKIFSERKNKTTGENITIQKDHLYQVHTAIGFETVSIYHDDRYPLKVLNYILGGGMSSLLFQELREKTGYAYSVYSSDHNYQDTGFMEIYYGTTLNYQEQCAEKVQEILKKLSRGDITGEDIQYAKDQMRGYTLIAQDSSDAKFSYNAKVELYYNEFIPLEKELERMYRVSLDDVVEVAQKYLTYDKAKFAVITPDEKTQVTN